MDLFVQAVAVFSMPGVVAVGVGPALLGVAMVGAWGVGLMYPNDLPNHDGDAASRTDDDQQAA